MSQITSSCRNLFNKHTLVFTCRLTVEAVSTAVIRICYIIMKKERRTGTSLLKVKTCFAQHVDEIKTENQKTQSYGICLGSWFNVFLLVCFFIPKIQFRKQLIIQTSCLEMHVLTFSITLFCFSFRFPPISTLILSSLMIEISKYVNMVFNIHRNHKAY